MRYEIAPLFCRPWTINGVTPKLIVLMVAESRQDRAPDGRGDGAALGDDRGVGQRFG